MELFDTFFHPKKKQTSHAYRITYRHMEKTFSQEEANEIHQVIEENAAKLLGVTIRWNLWIVTRFWILSGRFNQIYRMILETATKLTQVLIGQ